MSAVLPRRRYVPSELAPGRLDFHPRALQRLVDVAGRGAHGVRRLRSCVRPGRGGVNVACEARLDQEARPLRAAAELEGRIRAELEETAGVQVRSVSVEMERAETAGRLVSG